MSRIVAPRFPAFAEALRNRIRKERPNGGYKLVALTGWGQEARTADAGFDCHVAKPIDRDLLQEPLAGQ